MKLAHIIVVTPHKAGIYETTRDLAAAEIKAGVDARMIDPVKTVQGNDRGVPIESIEFVKAADIIINHSGLNAEMNQLDKPIIHMIHGRPYSTFLFEQSGKIAVMSFWRKIAGDPRYKRFVTFWPEFLPYFSLFLPEDKLTAITAPVDLEQWTPDGPSGYGFGGKGGKVNIVVTDVWRDDKDPFHVLIAAAHYANANPGTKIHIYAAPQKGTAWGILKATLRELGVLGEVKPFVQGLANVYRAADVMITPHRMATRSVREALACGCKVVMAPGNDYTPYQADPEDIPRYAETIKWAVEKGVSPNGIAESRFDSKQTAADLFNIVLEVM